MKNLIKIAAVLSLTSCATVPAPVCPEPSPIPSASPAPMREHSATLDASGNVTCRVYDFEENGLGDE